MPGIPAGTTVKTGQVELDALTDLDRGSVQRAVGLDVVAMSMPLVAYRAPWNRALLSRTLFPFGLRLCPAFEPLPPATNTSMREFEVEFWCWTPADDVGVHARVLDQERARD